MPKIKELLARGELIRVFGLNRIVHQAIVEIARLQGGFDAIWIDQEHGGFTQPQIELAALAARAHGFDSFVRLAPTDYAVVTRALEAGAGGVMAAQIQGADHAEQFVRWAKFHPRGCRGMNNGGVDGHYSIMPLAEFAERTNRAGFVAIQIETTGALEQADAIAAIEGVDLLFVGPSDLSQTLGVIGQFTHPRCLEAIDAVAAACKKHGKGWGVVPVGAEYAEMLYEKGCRMFVFAADTRVLHAGIRAAKQMYGRFFEG